MFGEGLLKGLKITLGWFFRKPVTVQYPEQRLPIPDRFFGRPEFDYDKCIACNQCVNACPNKVIKLTTETVDKKKVVTGYDFDQQYCMFCGMCQEACPKDAIRFTKDFELTKYHRPDIKIKFVQPEQVEKKIAEIKKAAAAKAEAEAAKEENPPSKEAS
ncbi:4Fe-4S ferredoxin iron-sulfur binding domain-containing protein [Desulfotomaculum nigrificans CO-1-SRB]|uniref:4Fe-4S ferredoxin iron-sulfur binding domain-containing protein n=1 Tax=Desulfotomaculum nigrificans (strain DSM 14880 / VKM B-2319 / CO-1-SRB) TaxID=868595 RepID=F6B3F6_DESCC|nr:NADH-quinone oxidoreductase subunit I [Desulfotomaculum nigrificans]AEF93985.1 4Fe-4S ferredoxin iron-sulfur binding domain-containing protein [Desulfotomaculum nigrificans CO-1-SRB]